MRGARVCLCVKFRKDECQAANLASLQRAFRTLLCELWVPCCFEFCRAWDGTLPELRAAGDSGGRGLTRSTCTRQQIQTIYNSMKKNSHRWTGRRCRPCMRCFSEATAQRFMQLTLAARTSLNEVSRKPRHHGGGGQLGHLLGVPCGAHLGCRSCCPGA